ncbi:MAG: hypothetical protein H8E03_00885 [Pelagibacteraceae bacterium]|nr:hypothetical protein [Pelagibacteraceae bacterium]
MATINNRDWLDFADELEDEVVEEHLKKKTNHKEKKHTKKEWKKIQDEITKKNNIKNWVTKRRRNVVKIADKSK